MGNDNWLHPASAVTKRNRVWNTLWLFASVLRPRIKYGVAPLFTFIWWAVTVYALTGGNGLTVMLSFFGVVVVATSWYVALNLTAKATWFEQEVLIRRFPQWVLRSMLKTRSKRPDKGMKYVSIAVKHPLLTADTIRCGYSHGTKIFRGELLSHDNASLDVLQGAWPEVLEQRDANMARSIVTHQNLDRETFQKFLVATIAKKDMVLLIHFMFSHLLTADDVRTLFAAMKQDGVTEQLSTSLNVIARHEITPTDVLDELALHPATEVRASVAENPNTSPRARTLTTIMR